jgi:hypothetical protein
MVVCPGEMVQCGNVDRLWLHPATTGADPGVIVITNHELSLYY